MEHVEPATFSATLVVLTKEGGRWSALVDRLRQLGAQVVTTEEFEGRCLTHLDLVLVDVGWVCASGRDLALVIEDLAHSSRTPVVALTDRGATAEIARALEAGACEFIDDSDDLDLAVLRTRFAQRAHVGRRSAGAGHFDDSNETPGLPTRARFVSALASAIERARLEQRHAVVLCLDVGRFRHLLGSLPPCDADELVLAVAERMRMVVRESDLLSCGVRLLDEEDIARVGGEEFSLLLEGLEHLEDAARIGHRLVQALARPFHLSGAELCLSMSVGIASYPSDGASAEALLKAAQTAALCSRQVGSDAVQFYSPMMNARAFERSTLESALRLAIERNELLLHYQPRISIADGRTVALEALVRWQHPQLGFVPPAHFIPLAEETGLIVELGEYVLERACAQNREWRRRGLAPVRVAVNVSPVQFRHPDLFASVLRTLSRTGLEPSGLELEITESGLMHGFEEVSNTLRRFKETGIEISIDDFGTGWSSLSYLRKFPVDALKIDQSFLREVTTNQEDASIVTAIVLMGKSLRLRVVAEGVETPGQLAFLRIMQCDEAQGFFLSRPLPAAEVERFLRAPLSIAA